MRKKTLVQDEPIFILLTSLNKKPLNLWNKKIRGGHINQLLDRDLYCFVLEIFSVKPPNTYITCPADPKKVLGIGAPFLHLTVKNLEMPFLIDVLVKDNKNVERRFRAMTKHKQTHVKPFACTMPLTLEKGWNYVTVPLRDFTEKAYGTRYVETLRVQLHATCRIQRIYFSHRNTPEP